MAVLYFYVVHKTLISIYREKEIIKKCERKIGKNVYIVDS